MSVWLRAAQFIAENDDDLSDKAIGCCAALLSAGANHYDLGEFQSVFLDDPQLEGYFWWCDPFATTPSDWSDQNARILALLLMHWMEDQ